MAHDVFISYSNKDKPIADAICAKLEESKLRVWIAPRDVPAGQNFAESIIEAIDTCKVFVLVWSANTNASEHILNEINQAFDQGITIIPFRIEDVQPTRAMRYYIGRTHWLDALTPPLEKHIGRLAETIFANLGRKPEVAPEPQPGEMVPTGEEVRTVVSPAAKPKPVIKPVLIKPGMEQEIHRDQEHKIASKKSINILPIAAGAVVLVTLVALFLSGIFKGSPLQTSTSDGTAPASFSTSSAGTATAAAPPTQKAATATANFPWVVDFAEPILAARKYQPPVFQDDFSFDQQNWQFSTNGTQCTNAAMGITDGIMQLRTSGDCLARACLSKLQLNNFVLQVDMDIKKLTDVGSYQINWRRPEGVGDNVFRLDGDKSWALILYENQGGIYRLSNGTIQLDETESVTITVISIEPGIAIYINDIPVTFLNDDRDWQPEFNDLCLLGFSDIVSTFDFDNFKLWDMDQINTIN